MRLLLINANTSPFVTGKVEAEARRVAAPGTEIRAVTGTFGPRVIGTRTENAIGAHSAVSLAAEHAGGCDAVVIAVSYDTAVHAIREMLDVPVIGMTEAAMHMACMLGGQVGLIVFGRRVLPMYREQIRLYGLESRVAGWRAIESSAPYGAGDQTAVHREIVATANDLAERDGAEAIVLSGAVMAGVPGIVQPDIGVPVLDGIGAGVRQAEALARLAPVKPRSGSFAALPARELVAVSPALAQRFAGPGR